MKAAFTLVVALFLATLIFAQKQKPEYKNGIIKLGDKEIARIEKTKDKENMGLTSTFEVFSMAGDKLIIAAYAGEFDQDPKNNMDHYYRLTFLTADQIGIFALSKLGTEKSLGKLLANSRIFADDKLDAQQVREFIAKKGKSPKIATDFTPVARDRSWPVLLNQDKTIEQNGKIIGSFRDITAKGSDMDSYEFTLPSGVILARVNFTGGNNAQNCEVHTIKDSQKRIVPITSQETIKFSASSIDRNQWALERITKWLVTNQYL